LAAASSVMVKRFEDPPEMTICPLAVESVAIVVAAKRLVTAAVNEAPTSDSAVTPSDR
jgi:hypothetical protein